MINLSYLLLIIYEMKYGLLSMGILTTLQTIAFIYYFCQKPPKEPLPPQLELPEILSEELEEFTFPQEPSKQHNIEMLDLLQKHKDSLIKYNEEIVKIQNEIVNLRDILKINTQS